MLLAGMVLSNLVEEKANKIIEILAAAIPMDAVFLGKLFAMLAISLVGIAVWATMIGGLLGLAGFEGLFGGALDLGNLPGPGVGWPAFLLLPVIFAVLQDQQVFSLRRRILDDDRLMYPVLLNLLSALLQAVISVHRALQIACACLRPQVRSEKCRPAGLPADLESVHRQIQTGRPVDRVLEQLIDACPLPEAQAALLLLLRYEQSGGADTIQLLALQSNACWSLHRSSIRKQLEQQNLRLLLPMTLDLVAVLVTALLPAVLSLQIL